MDKIIVAVVDDVPQICSAIERTLESAECVVHSFNNGLQVLEWLRQGNHPDLVITDTSMPEMTGPAWLAAAHNEALLDKAFVVIMSGDDADIAKKALACGYAHMFLEKPWGAGALDRILHKVMQEKSAINGE